MEGVNNSPEASTSHLSDASLPSLDQPLPTGEEKGDAVQAMFDTIAPRYDLVNRIMTFRLDVRWRRIAIESLRLAKGAVIVDLATGTGDFCRELAEAGYSSVGADFSFGMLDAARTAEPLIQGDGMSLPIADASVDGVTCGFALRNFVDLDKVFAELARITRPGGRIALLDASEPDNPIAKAGHGLYFGKVVPFIGGLLSNKEAYGYLPRSLAYLPPRNEMLASLEAVGFTDATHEQLTLGAAQLITATRV